MLKVLSAWGLRHQAQDQAVEILKLHSIPGWSEEEKKGMRVRVEKRKKGGETGRDIFNRLFYTLKQRCKTVRG